MYLSSLFFKPFGLFRGTHRPCFSQADTSERLFFKDEVHSLLFSFCKELLSCVWEETTRARALSSKIFWYPDDGNWGGGAKPVGCPGLSFWLSATTVKPWKEKEKNGCVILFVSQNYCSTGEKKWHWRAGLITQPPPLCRSPRISDWAMLIFFS